MTSGNDFDVLQEPMLFSALLRPHRALGRKGFLVLMGFISAVSFGAGMAFLLMGAWPVLGFFGLDLLAIYIAFRIYDRRSGATEEITVTPSEIRVRRVSPRSGLPRGIRHRATFSGLAWPPGLDRAVSGR